MWCKTAEPFANDHPCLAGHFPGNPIVPGTLILDRVIELLEHHLPEFSINEIITAKFMQPLLPEQGFELCAEVKPGQISFECVVDDQTITAGKLAYIESGSNL
ncbi:MAG: hydroxymyristoyl-ACP dehydratase [Candidatus Thiodiazotropha lotti]|nr:hydroxymyristoyl-ACP dehydratase [Candidatus Thiodiazotropha lotti]MCG8000561.1 hydroxymyristoyl-ACP dehydratase [Candidatus Thiodiazotropha lotti]MCW4181761.1 hydroxymyristoyl-ACP dehydratase [Candidatus Thiodiazotropha weberae]MCW4192332.1 hydroxymyristoyl-ACP dehydratase [Candidatus Thiodiazotropha weberae]